jgi:hypothetical protein
VLEKHEGGDEEDDPREQHGGHRETKEQIASWKAQAREAIADSGRREHRAETHRPSIEYAVR